MLRRSCFFLFLCLLSSLRAGQIVGVWNTQGKALVQVVREHRRGDTLFVVEAGELLAYLVVENPGSRQLVARLLPRLRGSKLPSFLSKYVTSELPVGYAWYEVKSTVVGKAGGEVLYVNAGDTSGFMQEELLFLQLEDGSLPAYVEDLGENQTRLRLESPQADKTQLLDRQVLLRFAAEASQPTVPTMLVEMPDGRRMELQVPIELTIPQWKRPKQNPYRVVIDTSRNRLYAYENDQLIHSFAVGTGRFGLQIPSGKYEIIDKVEKPAWIHPAGRVIAGGSPFNPLGLFWLGLNSFGRYRGYEGQYGLHGTNRPDTVGRYVSHGCIRLRNEEIAELYAKLPVGTPVEIRDGSKAMTTSTTVAFHERE